MGAQRVLLRGVLPSAWAAGLLLCTAPPPASGQADTPPASGQADAPPAPASTPTTAAPALPADLGAHVRAQRDAPALQLLDRLPAATADTPAVRYLRARLLQRSGHYAAALQHLPRRQHAGADLPAALGAELGVRRAVLLARLGQFARATKLAAELRAQTPPAELRAAGSSRAALSALLAESADARGQYADAAEAYSQALSARRSGLDTAVLLSGLARCQAALGDAAAARATLRRLYLERPLSPLGAEAPARHAALGAPLSPTPEERLQRAERMMTANMPAEAERALAGPWPGLSKPRRARLLHLRGMALFKQRTRYPEAARVLAKAARLGGSHALSDAFHAARALSRADRDRAAVRAYLRFARYHPQARLAARARYLAGFLAVRHGFPGGQRTLGEFIEGDDAKRLPGLGRSALLLLGLADFDGHRYGRAITRLLRYSRQAKNRMDRAQGLYWAGRAAQAAGRRHVAITHLRRAQAIDPLHYYGLLAQARLTQLGAPTAQPFAEEPAAKQPPASAAARPALPILPAFYAALGLDADAAAALRAVADDFADAAPVGHAARALAEAYASLGAHGAAYRVVLRRAAYALTGAPAGEHAWAHRAAYPSPYAALLRPLARAQGVAPAYVLAIMKKESAFDPHVVSSADAIGLLQLLPKTGKSAADALGLPFARESLFDPEVNLRLGTHYIGGLWRRFPGRPALAIAAFNAGAHQVDAWLSRAAARGPAAQQLDRFVEDIPIVQTRNYVRRVLTNWSRYVYLSDPAAGFPPLLAASVAASAEPPTAEPAASSARRR